MKLQKYSLITGAGGLLRMHAEALWNKVKFNNHRFKQDFTKCPKSKLLKKFKYLNIFRNFRCNF